MQNSNLNNYLGALASNMIRVVDSSYGALFEGDKIACADLNARPEALFTEVPFIVVMWINIFDPTLDD